MGPQQVPLGNIDPAEQLRNATPELVTEAIAACHRQAGARYVVGAGCEIPRDTPVENAGTGIMRARSQTARRGAAGR